MVLSIHSLAHVGLGQRQTYVLFDVLLGRHMGASDASTGMLDQSHGSLSQLVKDLELLRTNAAIFERLTNHLLRLQLGSESPTALLVPVESGPLPKVLLPVD